MSGFNNPFILPVEAYRRKLNPLGQYRQQCASFISAMTGTDEASALEFIRKTTSKHGKMPIKDKKLTYTERNEFGDRELKEGSYYQYLTDSWKRGLIMAPSLTMYTHPDKEKALHRAFINDRIGRRSAAKKLKFVYMAEGKRDQAEDQDATQNAMKISNNSLSGAQASKFNALYNKTAHSSLTSNCRVTSNYGSANNEKLLCGNRHYWGYSVVVNNIISICSNTDYANLERVMNQYQLKKPSVEDVLECIRHSTIQYWSNTRVDEVLRWVVERLTPLQRAAFVYIGDMYHIAKHNPSMMRKFLGRMSAYPSNWDDYQNLEERARVWKSVPEDILFLAAQIMDTETAGVKLSDLNSTKLSRDDLVKRGEEMDHKEKVICCIMDNVMQTMLEYSSFIHTFFTTEHLPASVSYFPESIRQTVVTGDTDSTIFTVQDWVSWFFDGRIGFSREDNALAATVIFISAQAIIHVLATMSANIKVAKENLFTIAMKNEYKFPVYVPTQVAKHYWAYKSCQEGIVFKEPELEKKGVHLKNSNAPKIINQRAEEMMIALLADYYEHGKISAAKYIRWVLEQEKEIRRSLLDGEAVYFRFQQIKPNASYKNPNPYMNNYGHYLFWNRVFAKLSSRIDAPPYMAIKVNLDISNKSSFQNWLENYPEIRGDMEAWLDDCVKASMEEKVKAGEKNPKPTPRKIIKTISVPLDIALTKGLPKPIYDWIDTRKTIFDMCKTFYIVMEAMGLFIGNVSDKKRLLYSDIYDIVDDQLVLKDVHIPSIPPIELTVEEEAALTQEQAALLGNTIIDDIVDEVPDNPTA